MNRLHNLFRLIQLSIKVFQANHEKGRYHVFVRRKTAKLMQMAREYNHTATGGGLEERMFLKIQWYMVTTLFTGEILAELLGKKLSEEEQMRYICLGAVFGLSDILIDDYKFTEAKMKSLLELKQPGLAATPIEKIFLHYHFALLHYLPEDRQKDVWAIFTKGGPSQIESLRQFDQDIPTDELEKVVMDKGGTSILLCRAVLSGMTALEETAFYQLGGLIQKMNDCVDLYKDGKEGIKSSANIFSSMEEIKKNLEWQKNKTFETLRSLPFENKKKEDFIFIFHVFVVSVFFKLHEYSTKCGGVFDYQKFLQLSKKEARSQPFSIHSFRYCFWRILNFRNIPKGGH